MSDNLKQKLIIITGSPCVGKTAVAERLFESYENSAYFDGDWAWCVNPFSIADPRTKWRQNHVFCAVYLLKFKV